MSLPVQNVAPQLVAGAGQTVFAFGWRCDDSTRVIVFVNDVLDGGYTVALNADQVAAPGGSITRGTPCVGGEIVTVERQTALSQGSTFNRYGAFQADTVTKILDTATMMLQELAAVLGRAFRVSRANSSKMSTVDFPAPANGFLLGWIDAGGGRSKIGNLLGSGVPVQVIGEKLTDSGDHTNFTTAFAPIAGYSALYRNGQRIFPVNDYTGPVGVTWTLIVPLGAGEQLNADYIH